MTLWQIILLWIVGLTGVVACGLFAGLETGVYSLNRLRLRLLVHQNDPRAKLMEAMLARPATVIATLLIGTNIATNMVTSAVGILLQDRGLPEWRVVLYDVVIVTPLLFIFAEVLPKDVFASYADKLVYPFAKPIAMMTKFFTVIPLVPLINLVSRVFMWLIGVGDYGALSHPRHQVGLLVREGVGMGLLSDEQSAIAQRVLGLAGRRVGDVAVAWDQVVKVSQDDPPSVLWDLANRGSVSRFPVINAGGRVVGAVNVYDALVQTVESCPPIAQLMRPAPLLEASMPIRAALAELQSSRAPLAIVTQSGKPVGMVTIKDLIEPITGELASW